MEDVSITPGEPIRTNRLKVLLFVVLSGVLLGPGSETRLYGADDEPAELSEHDRIENASVQFILVRVERETLEEHAGESSVLTLDSISLKTIGQCIHDEEGADIISQTKLTIVGGLRSLEGLYCGTEGSLITNEGLRQIEQLKQVRCLNIYSDNTFSDVALRRLQRNLPNLLPLGINGGRLLKIDGKN